MISVGDVARVSLPHRGKRGMLCMLEFFYDDSGSHGGSAVTVWGGIAGHKKFLDELQAAWDERLKDPCDGHKPPIKKFSSYDLLHATGEFEGYNQGAKDLTRKNFRDIIIKAGVSVLSYGISVSDWNAMITGAAKLALRSPEHTILALAIQGGCEAAIAHGESATFVFDKGASERAEVSSAFSNGVDAAGIDSDTVGHSVVPVLGNAGLQAADLVAHETYQMFCEYLASDEANPGPHLDRLRQGVHDFRAGWIGRAQIEDMIRKVGEAFETGNFFPPPRRRARRP